MTLLLLVAALALLVGAVAMWRAPRLPRYLPLLAIAAVPQIGTLLGLYLPGMFWVTAVALAAWALLNWRLAGMPILALGLLLNIAVMAAHGGAMPIRADVLAAGGEVFAPGTFLAGSKDVVVDSSWLWPLSDWLALRWGRYAIIASPGDLLILTGLLVWLFRSRLSERTRGHASESEQHAAVAHPAARPE